MRAILPLLFASSSALANPDAVRPPTALDAYFFTPRTSLEASLFYDGHDDDDVYAIEVAGSYRFSRYVQAGVRLPVLIGESPRTRAGIGNVDLSATLLKPLIEVESIIGLALVWRNGLALPTAGDVVPGGMPEALHAMPALYRQETIAWHTDVAVRADAIFWGGFFLEGRAGFEVGDPSYSLLRLGAATGVKPFPVHWFRVLLDYQWTRQLSGDAVLAEKGLHSLGPGIQFVRRDFSVGFRYLLWFDGPSDHRGASCDVRIRF